MCGTAPDGKQGRQPKRSAAERALRGIAGGRKNWTFLGSATGGRTAAVLLSLTATCRRHGVDPWAYLTDAFAVFRRRPPTASTNSCPMPGSNAGPPLPRHLNPRIYALPKRPTAPQGTSPGAH